jgi:TRAP-type C4-dicarboxylate transport system permease small subunit
MNALADALDRIGRALAGLCCAIMFVLLITDIVVRNFGVSFLWPIEYSGFLMAFIVFLPLAGVTRRREHMAADFFINSIGGSTETVSRRIIIPLATLVFCLGLLYLATKMTIESWEDEARSTGPLRTPIWIPQVVMVVSLVAMSINALIDLLRLSAARPASELDVLEKREG